MVRRALVSGSFGRIGEVGMALKDAGFTVKEVDHAEPFDQAVQRVAPRSLDCYVQLPADVDLGNATGTNWLSRFLTGPLLERVHTASMALPLLRPDATVLLVAGKDLAGAEVPAAGQFRTWFLQLLGRAMRAEPDGPTRAVVVGADSSPGRIAEIAVDPGQEVRRRIAECAGLGTELSFADWRREVLSRTSSEAGTV